MMHHRKNIKLFLMDTDATGRLSIELSNWTGKAYKIPRNLVKNCSDKSDLQTPGVYLLLNRNNDLAEPPLLYIGEAEDIFKRLTQHVREKDFWSEAFAIVSKDDNLNKAHIKYLESRLYEKALEAKRFRLVNAVKPTQSSISESDMGEMDEFLFNILLLVGVLGYNAFDPIRQTSPQSPISNEDNLFYINAAKGAKGIGKPTSEGFVIFENSQIADPISDSLPKSLKKRRDELIAEGIIVREADKLTLKKDYLLSSPSAAAALILGRSANGLTEWKMKNGRTLQNFETGDAD